MNFWQQIGLAGFVGGLIMLAMRLANVQLPRFPYGNGGTLVITLPSDPIIYGVLIGGLALLIVGSLIRRAQGEPDEDEDDEA